jgi:Xaa-Pro aminopeptidase
MTMETMQPTLKRGRDVWDRVNMPKAEFLKRVEKIREQMRQRGIDVLLLYASSGNEYGDPCYISNYIMKMPQGAVVAITRAGDVTLICEGFARDLPALKSITWVEDVRSCDDVSQRTVAFLKEKNLIPSTLGLVGLEQSMPHGQFQFFSESTKACKIVPADDMIRTMRMIKSQREADQVRRSSRLVSRMFERIAHGSFSQVNEKKLEAMIGREAYMEGAEDVRVLIAKPREGRWAFRPLEDVLLCDNHPIVIYLAVELERYWAEGIRTFLFKDSAFIKPDTEPVNSLYNQIIGSMTPGKRVSQFYRGTLDKIKANSMDVILEYGLGQGIGLSLQEPPFLSEEDATQLQEGMCLTFRLAFNNRELGAIMMGDSIHLSKSGPEVLTRE